MLLFSQYSLPSKYQPLLLLKQNIHYLPTISIMHGLVCNSITVIMCWKEELFKHAKANPYPEDRDWITNPNLERIADEYKKYNNACCL